MYASFENNHKRKETMIPNHERPDAKEQKFIVHIINELGYEPFHKPIHLYSLDDVTEIKRLYKQVKAG